MNEQDLRKIQEVHPEPTVDLYPSLPPTTTISPKASSHSLPKTLPIMETNTRPLSSHGGTATIATMNRPKSSSPSSPSHRRPSMEIDEIS
jgi:hypothetical protein